MEHAIEHSPNGSSGHEQREADIKLIVLAAAGLAVTVFITFMIIWGMFNVLKNTEPKEVEMSPLAPSVQVPPEPRVQEHPWDELRALHQHENKILNTYGWQDQKNGIVRIPIDRAIDIVAKKGLPVMQPGQIIVPPKQPVAPKAPGAPNAR